MLGTALFVSIVFAFVLAFYISILAARLRTQDQTISKALQLLANCRCQTIPELQRQTTQGLISRLRSLGRPG